MHRIGVVGVSWRHRRTDALAALTIPREERAVRLPLIARHTGVEELVYLATCNRVEVAFASNGRTPIAACRRLIFSALAGRESRTGEAEQTLRVWQGEGAVEHLFLVASGLDSARVGESEITGQVREALELARSAHVVGQRLERVFGEALKVAKRVRPVTEGHIGRVSLAQIALDHINDRIARTPGTVAVIGVSPMTEQTAAGLVARGIPIVIVNRTVERARQLAAKFGSTYRSLDDFRRDPDPVEALVIATGSSEPLLRRADLERLASRAASGLSPLIIDLSVPPNVAPEDAAAADVPRIGMDRISEEAASDREDVLLDFAEAREIVDDALTEYRRQTAERLVGPLIAQMRLRYRHTAMEGVERLFEKDLVNLGEPERDAVRRWAETLARRFAHVPSVGLRDLAFHIGPGAVEAFFEATEPDLARELREAAEHAGVGTLRLEADVS
jgi:glutamyl-tRNA reductase